LKQKKYTTIQRIKRLENIVSQIYMSVEVIKKQLEKQAEAQNPEN
tara:strand:- start:137 stop:271 length:135 start_codon:yes stop_codon:yes gene_type:complete